jgi:hypothetical protein
VKRLQSVEGANTMGLFKKSGFMEKLNKFENLQGGGGKKCQ